MDYLSDNIEFYELGDRVEGPRDLRRCKLKFNDSDFNIDVSAIIYNNFEDAKKLFKALCFINSPYVTKPHGLRKIGHDQEQGVVIVEEIRPFREWLDNNQKPDMWKVFGDNRTCIGIGYDFKRKFQQILRGLQSIHQLGYRHGSLLDGVFLGNDNKIRLSGFLSFHDDDSDSLKEDFRAFIELVDSAIAKHGTPPGVKQQLIEITHLKNLFNCFIWKPTLKFSQASWLYSASTFWNTCQKKSLFLKLSTSVRHDIGLAGSMNLIKDWEKKIPQNSPLYDVLTYRPLSGSRIKQAQIIVFLRNYICHSYIFVDPFDEVELIFPGITDLVYNQLIMSSYVWMSLVPRKTNAIPLQQHLNKAKHQKLGVETRDSSGNIKNTPIPTSVRICDYLNEEVSIWGTNDI